MESARALRTFDVVFRICSFSTLQTILAFSGCSKDVRRACQAFIRIYMVSRLSLYTSHPLDFIQLIRSSRAVIGGDVALDLAVLNQPTRRLKYRTLSVFVPRDSAVEFRGLLRDEGYFRVLRERSAATGSARVSGALVIDSEYIFLAPYHVFAIINGLHLILLSQLFKWITVVPQSIANH